MKISELFGITKSQHELDFVDVDIDSDTPLFLDPCRAVDDMPKLLERCSDTFKDSRGLIIPMVDNDFYDLLNYKSEKNEQAIDNFLQHRFHAIASK